MANEELANVETQMVTTLDIPDDQTSAVNVGAEDFDSIVSTYLPRVQLFDFNSDPVKDEKIKAGQYGIVVNTNITPVGNELVAFNLAFRLAAFDMRDTFKANYNHKSEEFNKIRELSKVQNSRCMAGPEFLLYLPDYKRFVTFMMGSKTALREAGEMRNKLRSLVALKSKLIQDKTYKWYGPVVTPCSTPYPAPPVDKMNIELEKFRNPPMAMIEEAAPADSREGAR